MGGKARWSQSQVTRQAESDVGPPAFDTESSEETPVKAMETSQLTSFRAFIKRHAVLTYITLVFALTLGPWGLALITASPGAFPGTGDELTPMADPDPVMLLAYLVGTLSPALAGILVIALAYGRAGLRDLRSQLFRWRVGVRWYAVALLTVPLLETAILGALLLTSKAFSPTIVTANDKASLQVTGLVGGLVVALVISFFEEIGWTGFAAHELRKRHGLLATGLILGLPWGVMHLPAYTASGAVPPALEVAAIFFYFVPYRMLMVWVYDHTQSVLLAILMHLPLILFVYGLLTPAKAGVPELIFNLVFGATLWVFVAAVAAANRRNLSRAEHMSATPQGFRGA
jgi:membrane protease YdiL (CAAX protease family)